MALKQSIKNPNTAAILQCARLHTPAGVMADTKLVKVYSCSFYDRLCTRACKCDVSAIQWKDLLKSEHVITALLRSIALVRHRILLVSVLFHECWSVHCKEHRPLSLVLSETVEIGMSSAVALNSRPVACPGFLYKLQFRGSENTSITGIGNTGLGTVGSST
eukprot:scaffold286937_cov18-Tisochrysis_lutea.AAC.1